MPLVLEIRGDFQNIDLQQIRQEFPDVRVGIASGFDGSQLLSFFELIKNALGPRIEGLRTLLIKLLGADQIRSVKITKDSIEIANVPVDSLAQVEKVISTLQKRLHEKST